MSKHPLIKEAERLERMALRLRARAQSDNGQAFVGQIIKAGTPINRWPAGIKLGTDHTGTWQYVHVSSTGLSLVVWSSESVVSVDGYSRAFGPNRFFNSDIEILEVW